MQNVDQSEYYSRLPLPEEPTLPIAPPGPDNPPWGVPEAIGVWFASMVLVAFTPLIFLLPYLASMQPITSEEVGEFVKTDPVAIFLGILGIIPAHLLTILLAWLVITRARRYSFREMLGWKKAGFVWWHYCIILIGFAAVAHVVTEFYPEQENDLLRILKSSRAAVYIVAFVATFTAPLVEEVTYRGVLYSAFQRKFGVPAAFIFVSLLFSLVHWLQYWPSYSTIFLLTLVSVVLTVIRVRSNNLLPCTILHTVFNGIQAVLLILEPYLEPYLRSLETQEQPAAILRTFL